MKNEPIPLPSTHLTGYRMRDHVASMDIGRDYAATLALWRRQFNDNVHGIHGLGFSNAFIRK